MLRTVGKKFSKIIIINTLFKAEYDIYRLQRVSKFFYDLFNCQIIQENGVHTDNDNNYNL